VREVKNGDTVIYESKGKGGERRRFLAEVEVF